MKKKDLSFIWQDVGLLLMILVILAVVATSFLAEGNDRLEILIMTLVMFIPIAFAAFRARGLSFALVGLQTLVFAIYKIFMLSAYTVSISEIAYVWVFIPILAVIAMNLFTEAVRKLELFNEFLSDQTENLVLIDEVTGLYNRRSLFNDLSRDTAYSVRKNLDLTLAVIELKYADELQKILTEGQFNELKRMLADKILDALRIEDKVYAINDKGGIATILMCDKAGADVVIGRIRGIAQNREAFSEILGRELKVELKIGVLQYNNVEHQNVIEFVRRTENELQYDV